MKMDFGGMRRKGRGEGGIRGKGRFQQRGGGFKFLGSSREIKLEKGQREKGKVNG
jgi:hypothetical protein